MSDKKPYIYTADMNLKEIQSWLSRLTQQAISLSNSDALSLIIELLAADSSLAGTQRKIEQQINFLDPNLLIASADRTNESLAVSRELQSALKAIDSARQAIELTAVQLRKVQTIGTGQFDESPGPESSERAIAECHAGSEAMHSISHTAGESKPLCQKCSVRIQQPHDACSKLHSKSE